MYVIKKTYKFENSINGATRFVVRYVKRTTPTVLDENTYHSNDSFTPQRFGNGFTSVTESLVKGFIGDMDSIPEDPDGTVFGVK